MKVSWNWLKQYLDLSDLSPEYISERLTSLGLEVESVEFVSPQVVSGGDILLDVISTANRSDALSIIGIARELSLCLKRNLKTMPRTVEDENSIIPRQSHKLNCESFVIGHVEWSPKLSIPLWMTELLISTGITLTNDVRDILQYVMYETGFPLGAFDISFSNSNNLVEDISIRNLSIGEIFISADNRSYPLSPDIPVIIYDGQPLSIAGILYGLIIDMVNFHAKDFLSPLHH